MFAAHVAHTIELPGLDTKCGGFLHSPATQGMTLREAGWQLPGNNPVYPVFEGPMMVGLLQWNRKPAVDPTSHLQSYRVTSDNLLSCISDQMPSRPSKFPPQRAGDTTFSETKS